MKSESAVLAGHKPDVLAEEHVKKYYERIAGRVSEQYEIAREARMKGRDFSTEVESTPAADLADRTELIIGPKGVAKRFRELSVENKDRRTTIFRIVEEIINQEWVKIPEDEARLEQAVKTALVLETEGIVVAPLDGVPKVKIGKNFDGSRFVDIYYAGPIRAAGGTATVLPLLVGDYARKLMGIGTYKPTEAEVERYVEEINIYDEIVTRQYKISPDEVRKIVRGCPVCINGEPTSEKGVTPREVTTYKDLERVPTNRVRGGACLVICEGIALKAKRIMHEAKKAGLDWSWLEGIIKIEKGSEKEKGLEQDTKYLDRVAAGRPILAYPSRIGGFRLRYGRARNTGIMGKALHPATMHLLDEFIAVGTQMKVERPGKSTVITPCDTIEGPIVRLNSGEVRQVRSLGEAVELEGQVERILFLGDCLATYGDFKHGKTNLVPAGYCEEWWALDLAEALKKGKSAEGMDAQGFIGKPNGVGPFTAVELSMQLGIPLHPHYLAYYKALGRDEVARIARSLEKSRKVFSGSGISGLVIPDVSIKPLLEKIGLPHRIGAERGEIEIGEECAYPFLKTFGGVSQREIPDEEDVLKLLSALSGIEIRDKGGTFIGARMGRPEAAKPGKMEGHPNVLFPVGLYGGNTRSINKAMDSSGSKAAQKWGVGAERTPGKRMLPGEGIEVEVASYWCSSCGRELPFAYCPSCGKRSRAIRRCPKCRVQTQESKCRNCGEETVSFSKRAIRVDELVNLALENLRVKMPDILKGVKGMINDNKVCEPLEKGILRARNNLYVYKDGTTRFEMLNVPLTHFRPDEAGLTVKQARELGYEKDMDGEELKSGNQLLEMMPQDVVINESAGDYFVQVAKFIDDLLERFYCTRPYYNVSSRKELIGELVMSIAPHTSAGVVGRIIGFTPARVNFAHPYFHMVKRRNCDGEQDAFMLLADVLLNFSQGYLSASRGGRMDAPLVFTVAINPAEIDAEVYNMEVCPSYPLELYEAASEFAKADLASVETVSNKLGTKKQYSGFGFTHGTACIDAGPKISRYVQLATMGEKIKAQARLQSKIAAVDEKDALERVVISHLLPDIIGNARTFSRQKFRCTKCNSKYRRIPLSGKCAKCGESSIMLTVAQGSVRKYIEIAKELISSYGLSDYLKQRIALAEKEVDSIFTAQAQTPEQRSLLGYV